MRLLGLQEDQRGKGKAVKVQGRPNERIRGSWQGFAAKKPLVTVALVLCLMALWSLTAQAATVISVSTRWTAANSPYRIGGDLIVKAGVTLTIEPGVEVRFAKVNVEEGISNRAEMLVEGTLLAFGTVDAPIRFLADTGTDEMGAWAGVVLKGSSNKLEYVNVQHALTGVKVNGSAEIRFSTIEKNLETGILLARGGSLLLQSNEFAYNEVGFHCEGTAEVRENRFQSNSYGMLGISVGNQVIAKNSFESNTYGIYLEAGQPGNQITENLISGNDYGIYVDGGVPPRANHNDIYNNGVFDFFHQAKSDADARYNWWGTTNTGAIDLQIFDQKDNRTSVKYGYVDYSGYLGLSALAPTILNLTATPAAIRSGELTVTVTFSKEMHTVVKPTITYGLLDPFTTYTVDPAKGKWISYNQYQFTVQIPETMPEGQYRLRIAGAEALDGQLLKPNIAYTFTVDRTPPKVSTGVDYFAISPNGDGRMDTMQAELNLNEPTLLTYGIYQGSTLVYGPIAETLYLQAKTVTWNGKNNSGMAVGEGDYFLRVTVKDRAGNQSTMPTDLPIIVDLTPPLLRVDHIVGIQMGDIILTGEVSDRTETLTYLDYRRKGTTEWNRLGQLEGTVSGTLYNWVVGGLLDGVYELQAEAEDRAWNRTQIRQEVDLDSQPPDAVIISPTPDAHVAQSLTIMGRVADAHLRSWRLELETTNGWTALASGAQPVNGEMAHLNLSTYADGDYRLRLVAEDQVGRVTENVQSFNVDNATPPVVKGTMVSPQAFSPNGDGVKDSIQFLIYFSEVTNWQMTILNGAGQSVRSQSGSGAQLQWIWDGLRTDGSRAADGSYAYRVTYVDQVNHPGVEVTGTFTLDTVPPVLTVNSLPALTSEVNLTITGQVANFEQVEINEQKIVVTNGTFTWPVQLAEGMNTFTVIASDLAGNQAKQVWKVTRDTTLPLIHLNPLKEVTNRAAIELSGWIEEVNLASGQVRVENELGQKEMALKVLADQTFAMNLNLAVGINQVTVRVVDGAGNTAERNCTIQYSPTVPEMYLIEPAIPYVSSAQIRVVLKVLEGSEPLEPTSITVDLDGVRQVHTWNAATKEVHLDLSGLSEGEHQLIAQAKNVKGESSGGLVETLFVDLTDPVLSLDEPADGVILDGWDGPAVIRGVASDANLQELQLSVKQAGGTEKIALTQDWRGKTQVQGELAEWRVGEWPNGRYTVTVTVRDRAGRETALTRQVEVRNTGVVSGRVRGDLDVLRDPLLLVANGVQIADEIPFDSVTGGFSKRVQTGEYLLALAPWGYDPVILRPVKVLVGETLSNLDLTFESEMQLGLSAGKQLISLPLTLSNEPAGAGSEGITVKGWDGVTYYGLNEWTLLKPGRGYWVIDSAGTGLGLNGEPVARTPYRLPLTKGWNLIATPYNYPYPLNGVTFVIDGVSYTLDEAVSRGKVDRGIWKYQNWYQQAKELLPWQGYWLYANGVGEAVFSPELALYPYQSLTMLTRMALDRIQTAEWRFQIRASLGNASDVENVLGTAQGATGDVDAGLDLREPPGYAPYVSLYFLDQEGEALTASYQEPLSGQQSERVWEMRFDSSESGLARLQWELDPDATVHLSLLDVATGKEIDMLAVASYSFEHQGGEVRKFVITAQKHDFEIKRVHNYPNPFSAVPSATGKEPGTHIRYLLTENAPVEITIYDVVGRSVKRFPLMEAGKPGGTEGWNEIYWDGRNGKGEPVANGVYLVQVKARYGKKYYVKTGRMATINGR